MSYLFPSLVQPGLKAPLRDKYVVFGTSDVKGVFTKEADVSIFTIDDMDDPRTLNKVLYLRPPGNVYSLNGLVWLWKSKLKKSLDKIYITEEELLKKIKGYKVQITVDSGVTEVMRITCDSRKIAFGGGEKICIRREDNSRLKIMGKECWNPHQLLAGLEAICKDDDNIFHDGGLGALQKFSSLHLMKVFYISILRREDYGFRVGPPKIINKRVSGNF